MANELVKNPEWDWRDHITPLQRMIDLRDTVRRGGHVTVTIDADDFYLLANQAIKSLEEAQS